MRTLHTNGYSYIVKKWYGSAKPLHCSATYLGRYHQNVFMQPDFDLCDVSLARSQGKGVFYGTFSVYCSDFLSRPILTGSVKST